MLSYSTEQICMHNILLYIYRYTCIMSTLTKNRIDQIMHMSS